MVGQQRQGCALGGHAPWVRKGECVSVCVAACGHVCVRVCVRARKCGCMCVDVCVRDGPGGARELPPLRPSMRARMAPAGGDRVPDTVSAAAAAAAVSSSKDAKRASTSRDLHARARTHTQRAIQTQKKHARTHTNRKQYREYSTRGERGTGKRQEGRGKRQGGTQIGARL